MIYVKNEFGEGDLYEIDDIKGTIYFVSQRCHLRVSEMSQWISNNPKRVVDDIEHADNIIMMACQATNYEIYNMLTRIKRLMTKFFDKSIYLTGCLAQRFDVQLFAKRMTFINPHKSGNYDMDKDFHNTTDIALTDYISTIYTEDNYNYNSDLFVNAGAATPILVSRGCFNKCSYCTIRKCVGEYIEFPPEGNRLECFMKSRHVLLDGDCIKSSVTPWLELALKHKKYTSISNIDHTAVVANFELLKKLAEQKMLVMIYCAIQSLDEKILKAMNRDYQSTKKAVELMQELRKFGTIFSTDIIIDFPVDGVIYKNYDKELYDKLFDVCHLNIFSSSQYNEEETKKILKYYYKKDAENLIPYLDIEL
ncbi:MAG: hypothetical protein FWD32_00825 [Firmicutes bacterium]|nr:hypothetical protein [Bacillota bacterium]